MKKKTRRSYPAEYRQRMLDLVRSGSKAEALAKEFEPSAQTIRNWMKQADLDAGRRVNGRENPKKDGRVVRTSRANESSGRVERVRRLGA